MKTSLLFHLATAALIVTTSAQTPTAQPPPTAAPPAADSPVATAVFEQGVVFHAPDIFPANLLQGPSYRMRDQVVTDGFMAHFEIDSDFGTFAAIGVPQAKTRITEIKAIRILVNTSKSDLFAEGMKRSIEQPIDAVKNIVTHPVESVKQAPKTVGHFFSKIGSSISRGAKKIQDSNESDADVDAGDVAHGIGDAAKNAAGFQKAKLDTAKQLGVDPYSDNVRLQEEMDKVTWAFFAGGLPLRVGAAVVSAGVAVAATNMVGIPEDMYALTPAEIALRDQNALTAMGVAEADIDQFQIHPPLSITRRHRIVTLLGALPKAEGRGYMIRLANSCETAEQADVLIGALAILAERQRSGAADYTSLKMLGRLPGATTITGNFEVPAPVDYVSWTERVAGFAQRDDLGDLPKFLIHTGLLSPVAGNGFTAAGWTTVIAPYPSM